ncbi:MAG: hypothetical protein AAF512_05270 [Pseudomonadota bacterium]
MNQQAVEGARNLLLNCANIRAGERVLILHEDPVLGWYDTAAPMLVAQVARELGAVVEMRQTGGPDNCFIDGPADGSAEAKVHKAALIDADCDCCIFFARIGDQLRFDQDITGPRRVMSYITSIEALASDYGRVEYQAMVALKGAINRLLLNANTITLSCPLGSDLRGQVTTSKAEAPEDVTVSRFPAGVHAPIDAAEFAGEIRLARYLTPTGSRVYAPASINIGAPVTAQVANGRIIKYLGQDGDVQHIQHHYQQVAQQFSLDANALLSWHAGIHPGCRFFGEAADDPDRWSNTVFTNPRFAHFHTCGNETPGEICWMVLDPTICIGDIPLWENGVLQLEQFSETRLCLERWPSLRRLFDEANEEIGLLT